MSTDFKPPPRPTADGFYWAYPIWELSDEYRMIVFVSHTPRLLLAADFKSEPWLHCRELTEHDILRWGPRVEFPELDG